MTASASTEATDPVADATMMPPSTEAERLAATQKNTDAVSVYFARKVSRHVTPVFLALGLSANGATAVWGLISLFNSFVIYLTIGGAYYLLPLVFILYFLVVVIDCVDGEIARYRHTASPIGGKLLDGVWHKATEYSLLIAYTAGAHYWTGSLSLMPIGLVLLAGEAMYTFVYERRLTVIRVYAKSSEYISPVAEDDFYRKSEKWSDFPRGKKLKAFKGLILYKSVYFMIAISYLSSTLLFWGVVLLAAYKHYAWMKLLLRTVNHPPRLADE